MRNDSMSLMSGAACGLLAVVAFSVLYSVAASRDPGYVFLENYLSDLGVGPAAWAFNSALMVAGALIVAFAYFGLHPILGGQVASRAGPAALGLAGIFLVNVGIFTEDYGDTHYAFSVAFFLTLLVALGALAYAFYRTKVLGQGGWLVSASASSFGLLLLAMGFNPFTETLAVLTALVWGALTALMMLYRATGRQGTRPS